MEEKDIIHRMIVAHTITPDAWLAITEADKFSPFTSLNTRRVYDEWHIAFRARLGGRTKHVEHVAFFELLDGTMIAQVLGKDDRLHVMVADS